MTRTREENAADSKYEASRERLLDVIEAGVEAVQLVTDSWEQGDLAEAVRHLEDWAVNMASDVLPDEEQ